MHATVSEASQPTHQPWRRVGRLHAWRRFNSVPLLAALIAGALTLAIVPTTAASAARVHAQGLSCEITTTSLTPATPGVYYRVTLQVGGDNCFAGGRWKKLGGKLPKGLALHHSGVLSGTPKSKLPPGTYSFIARYKAGKPGLEERAFQRLTLTLL